MNFRALPYLAAVSATITILAGVWVLNRSEQQRFREQRRIDALHQVSTVRARLEGALNSRLFLTEGLVAHVSTHPDIDLKEFQTLARVLVAKQSGIRIIELAKNTAISHIYPPENEAALGIALLEKPQERQAIARAIKTRSTVVAGPIHWNDGTKAFISHTPIFITPKGGVPKSGPYWGLATIIINKNTLLAEAGLERPGERTKEGEKGKEVKSNPVSQSPSLPVSQSPPLPVSQSPSLPLSQSPSLPLSPSPSSSLKYALRGQDGLGVRGAVFCGDASVFEQNPVLLEVSLPNGSWQLAAIPIGGWPRESPISGWLRLGGGALALLSGVLVFVLVQAPARSREAVARATVALRQAEEKYRSIFENAVEGIFQTLPNGRYLSANPALARIYGYCNTAELLDKLNANAKLYVDPNRRAEFTSQIQLHDQVSKFESQVYRRDGQPIWISENARAVRNNRGEVLYYEGIVEDITERKRVEDQLLHNAFHDALTGLPNRLMFMERLSFAIKRAKEQSNYKFAVLFLDLDRFKVINDSLGHIVGDQLLIAFAQRLHGVLRENQQPETNGKAAETNASDPSSFTIARLGGDEFTILLEDLEDAIGATQVADRIQKHLTLPFNLNGHEIFTTASIGIVLNWELQNKKLRDLAEVETQAQPLQISAGGATNSLQFKIAQHYEERSNLSLIRNSQFPIHHSPEDLLRDADIAMYQAKAMGKARHAVFDTAMYTGAVARLQLETDLRRAISAQEFQVYYQPIVCLENGRINGFEALVRWEHPHRGLVSPSLFIPLAEETGLIIPLGSWVLREACRQTRAWQLQFPSNPSLAISVNLSGQQFLESDLIEKFKQILQETGLNGSSLKLEITESVITEGAFNATAILKRLRDLDIQLCIDDFGTGYSSLSRLHHFPINTLKIDRSFVSRMGKKGRDRGNIGPGEIVQTIVMLAHNLGMDAIAEGVETAEQLAQLKLHNCEYGQGYFFSRPLTSIAATALLAKQDYKIN